MRLLGFLFLLVICLGIGPWGLVVFGVVCFGWLLFGPEKRASTMGSVSTGGPIRSSEGGINAIPLLKAVYCANCDLITNSPHDDCSVCGSHSVIAVARMWQLVVTEARPKVAKYRVSVAAEIHEIPANELSESTKLISRLAELGGEVRGLHIQVDAVSDAVPQKAKIAMLKPVEQTANAPSLDLQRRAS